MFIRKSLNPKLDKLLRFKSQPHLKVKPPAQNFMQDNQKQTQQKAAIKYSKYPNVEQQQKLAFSTSKRDQVELQYQQTGNSFYKRYEKQSFQKQQNYRNHIQKPIDKNQRQNKKFPISYFNQTIGEKTQNPQKIGVINRQQSQNIILMHKSVDSLESTTPLQNYQIKIQAKIRLPQVSSKYLKKTLINLYKPSHQQAKFSKTSQSLPQKKFTVSGAEKQQSIQNTNKNQPKFHPFCPLKAACAIKNSNFKQMHEFIKTIKNLKNLKNKDDLMKEFVVIRKYGKFF